MRVFGLYFCSVAVTLQVQFVVSIIPEECADATSLRSKVCCPNDCGGQMRGECMRVTGVGDFTGLEGDIRYQWPLRLFSRVCKCEGNYEGVDCSSCKFGYQMDSSGDCIIQQIRTRRSLSSMTDNDWALYRVILNQTKHTPSRYFVVTESFQSAISSVRTSDDDLLSTIVRPNLYDLFIWIHHFVAKDSESKIMNIDFAHEFTGFLTWHRLFLLWVEREIQETVDKQFVLHYWNWTNPEEREKYFKSGYLNILEPPFNEWPAFCWYEGAKKQLICNATEPVTSDSGRIYLRRCPDKDACSKGNAEWPSTVDMNKALGISSYDTPGFNKLATDSFRNYLEGFVPVDFCYPGALCKDNLQRKLHNSVHLLLGPGKFTDYYTGSQYYNQGVMGDVAASPNDPIFFNHHTMIDCIMEEWINGNGKDVPYPISTEIREGHRGDDYIVPFLPLYKHNQFLVNSNVFGYTCDFKNDENNDDNEETDNSTAYVIVGVIGGFGMIFGIIGTIIICYRVIKYLRRQ